ncbi:hypothetical protein OG738_31695 [Amycolatopsis sp. NBC_01488]|uniref:hypothetical protein n=1 Tax=Amycolatopsis sp. NBC_01488 TaxID=2903563 RepID=UPI002E2D3412|nr:hypothetical protein [Amycolatopsis sp. NBC_01488]
MIVLRLIGTVLWFAVPAGLLTYAIHELGVRDAPTYDIEGTVVPHRQVYHPASGPDTTSSTTYFITVRDAGNEDFEFGDGQQALDTAPGTPVVVKVAKGTDEIVLVRKGGTVVDLRATIGDDVGMIVFGGLGLLVAFVRESLLEDYDIPRWAGFLLGALAAGGGVYVALRLAG